VAFYRSAGKNYLPVYDEEGDRVLRPLGKLTVTDLKVKVAVQTIERIWYDATKHRLTVAESNQIESKLAQHLYRPESKLESVLLESLQADESVTSGPGRVSSPSNHRTVSSALGIVLGMNRDMFEVLRNESAVDVLSTRLAEVDDWLKQPKLEMIKDKAILGNLPKGVGRAERANLVILGRATGCI
jgi:hypothetical protein